MFGLVVLLAIGVYLLVSFVIVRWSISHARKSGKSAKRWGWSAALVMFMIPFWDWIPTVATHQYYCTTEAGFWVYKTPEQWKKENPGVMETLVATKGVSLEYRPFDDGHGKSDTYRLNDRFNWVVMHQDISSFLSIIRIEQEVKDAKKNEVLARYIDFATGNSVKHTSGPPGPLKFWLINGNCLDGAFNKSRLIHFADSVDGTNSQGEKQ